MPVKKNKSYVIGIDTGGTYTDAALFDASSQKVLATAKKATTHHDLSIGAGHAVESLITRSDVPPEEISSVALSSTLATNAVVEGKGARVGLFIVGYPKEVHLDVAQKKHLAGGHDFMGQEKKPLDLDTLVSSVDAMKSKVDAYAVTSSMSFKNPTHELVASKAVSLVDPKPVFCSHQASEQPGVAERAATAALNARLMPMMEKFLKQSGRALRKMGMDADIHVVRGNGRTMSIDQALQNSSATVASGPAASTCFGAAFSSNADAAIVDVGGTTTDVTMIAGGKPVLDKNGITVGNYSTHVEAVRMFTSGIGGDSLARFENGRLKLGPVRVRPICMTPEVPNPKKWLGPEERSVLILAGQSWDGEQAEDNSLLKHLVENGPATYRELMDRLGTSLIRLEQEVADLARKDLVVMTGLTPTDCLHCTGQLDIGDTNMAMAAVDAAAQFTSTDPADLARTVLAKTMDGIEDTVVQQVMLEETGHTSSGIITSRRSYKLLKVRFELGIPLVGLGAASRHLLPQVAKRLGTTVEFPSLYDAGNAVGAGLIFLREQNEKG